MDVKKIIIHCSDSPDARKVTASDIHSWHQERGWDGIGYHYVILRTGQIEKGRPDYWTGAHAAGYNDCSLGICLIGRNHFTEPQHDTLHDLVVALVEQHNNPQVSGHRDVDRNKSCPNFDVSEWLEARGLDIE